MSFKGTVCQLIGTDKNLSSFSHERGRASKFPRRRSRRAAVWQGPKKRGPLAGPRGWRMRHGRAGPGRCGKGRGGGGESPPRCGPVTARGPCPRCCFPQDEAGPAGPPIPFQGCRGPSGRSVPDRPTPVRPWAARAGAASRDAASGNRHPAAACGSCSGWAARSA